MPYDRYPVEVSDAVIGRGKKREQRKGDVSRGGWGEREKKEGGQGETIVERRIK